MPDLIAYISKNHIEVMNLKNGKTVSDSANFTSTRLLVGDFPVAESLLRDLVKKVRPNGLFSAKPVMVIQPLEMTEGGLSAVEERVFLELGGGAGAREVKVHVGDRLTRGATVALFQTRG